MISDLEQKYGYNQYWIGAYHSGSTFEWATGIQMADNDYKHWAPHEPDLDKGDCVYEESNGWHSDECNDFMHAHHFICQKNSCMLLCHAISCTL
ncbi:unnamed protein product [Anisakis simplex]|uniref:C-type lectin domain-containing protein n=1 Tax=Anisakis simplex TaxID=6269 RepID=A0A0M3J6T2_ANISI|nr:unnamed protein product [Anisakis simplex]